MPLLGAERRRDLHAGEPLLHLNSSPPVTTGLIWPWTTFAGPLRQIQRPEHPRTGPATELCADPPPYLDVDPAPLRIRPPRPLGEPRPDPLLLMRYFP